MYILASISDVLAKKHDVMGTAKEIMESLKGMFGQPSFSLGHEAIKYIYSCRTKEGTSVREHVLDMMVHFNVAEENEAVIDEKSQVSFIMMSLPKSFFQFHPNVVMNKIEYNLTALLNELQTYEFLLMNKGQAGEANVDVSKKLLRGSSSKNKSSPSTSKNVSIKKKGKGKDKIPIDYKRKVQNADKGKCFHCNENGHWKRNCLKYLIEKKAEKAQQGNYDLLVVEICLVEYDNSTCILDSGATDHICSFFRKLAPGECLRTER